MVQVNVKKYEYPYFHGQFAKSWTIEKTKGGKNYRTINRTYYDIAHQFPFWIEYGHRAKNGSWVPASGELRKLKGPALTEFANKLKSIPVEKLIRVNQYE